MTLMRSRRDFLRESGFLIAASSAGFARVFAAEGSPCCETAYGRVRGVETAGIKSSRASLTAPAPRARTGSCRPSNPAKWTGVRDALAYGPSAPQRDPDTPRAASPLAVAAAGLPAEGEDCLVLNVWTPAVDDGRKRPGDVLVSRRRLRHRLGVVAGDRRHQSRAPRRRGRRDDQPPPQRAGLHLPRARRAAASSRSRATSACSTSCTRFSWVRDQHRRSSAAIRTPSRSSASRAAAGRSARCWRCRRRRGCFTARPSRAARRSSWSSAIRHARGRASCCHEAGLNKSQVRELQNLPVRQDHVGLLRGRPRHERRSDDDGVLADRGRQGRAAASVPSDRVGGLRRRAGDARLHAHRADAAERRGGVLARRERHAEPRRAICWASTPTARSTCIGRRTRARRRRTSIS